MKSKKVMKVILITIASFVVFILLMFGSLIYKLNYEVRTVDVSKSPNGKHTLLLQSVGEPVLFGSAKGQLVLEYGKKKIVKYKFSISDDGGPVRKESWKVLWKSNYVEVILSGDEQMDEAVKLRYDGKVESRQLDTYGGKHPEENTVDSSENNVTEENKSENYEPEMPPMDMEQQLEQKRIFDGYHAIYDSMFKELNGSFIEDYDAKGHSRVIVYEDDTVVKYLVYDRKSANEKCGLYVYYSREKNEDGSWNSMETILNMYAYVYENGDVVESGKTDWADTSTEEYRRVTGEP